MGGNMYDHYHDVREVQGAAADGHSHSARDVGAPDEHEFTMLARDMRAVEGEIATLGRDMNDVKRSVRILEGRVGTLSNENEWLREQLIDWGRRHAELQQLTGEIVVQVRELTDALAAALTGRS